MKKKIYSYGANLISLVGVYIIILALINSGVIDNYYKGILIIAGINIILATSLNLATGFLGQLALGHAGFMSVGAYATALFTMNVSWPILIRFPVGLIVGGITAAFFGLVIGIPALRLKGDYLAIITLGFGEIIRVIILNLDFTGGARGLKGIPNFSSVHYVYWVMVAVVCVLTALIRSRHGRAIISVREDEVAAEASGINTTYYKILAFTIAAFFAGIAGGLYAHHIGVLDPSNFGFMRSIEIIVMVVLGGMGSFTGSIIAAIVLTIAPEALRAFAGYRMLVYSLLLIIMMLFKPSGLLGQYEFSLSRLFRRGKALTGGEE